MYRRPNTTLRGKVYGAVEDQVPVQLQRISRTFDAAEVQQELLVMSIVQTWRIRFTRSSKLESQLIEET